MTAIVIALTATKHSFATTYTFTKIVDSAGPLAFMASGPAINNSGVVVFQSTLDGGGEGIFRGDGGPLTTIASGTSTYPQFTIRPDINDAGIVCYVRTISASASRVEANDGAGGITIIADSTGPSFSSFVGYPRVNDASPPVVAFAANKDGGGTGIFKASSTAGFATIATNPAITGVSPNYTINSSGTVAFRGNVSGGVGWAILKGAGGATTTIANAAGPYSSFAGNGSINDAGMVVFRATLDSQAGDHFYFGDGMPATTVVDTLGPFSFLYVPGINDNPVPTIAYRGLLDDGTLGIYTGPDPVADKVIEVGDDLDGSTIVMIQAHNRLINDSGQIAFQAVLADGRDGVWRADPVPDVVPCPADVTGNGVVDVDDLLEVINRWGGCEAECPPVCLGDVDDTCAVDVDDLLVVINAWGACPR